jgi:hypothetical protein
MSHSTAFRVEQGFVSRVQIPSLAPFSSRLGGLNILQATPGLLLGVLGIIKAKGVGSIKVVMPSFHTRFPCPQYALSVLERIDRCGDFPHLI